MACNYSSKFIPLIVSKVNYYGNDVEGLKKWFQDSFYKGLDVYTRYMSGALFSEKSTTPTNKVSNKPYYGRFTQDVEYNAIQDYFKGANDLQIQAEHSFKTEIVKRIIFDITKENAQDRWKNPTSVDEETGVTFVNKAIAKYKEDLCNELLSEIDPENKVSLNSELSDSEYNNIIQDVITKYKQFLSTNPKSAVKYTEFTILSLFDEYLKQNAPFITPRSEFINKVTNQVIGMDSYDKYEYHGPKVEHYTGFTSSEFAAIENQDSDLAKLLLDTIPDVNEVDGQLVPIPGSFIGLSGFNSAMSSMKNWILYEAPIEIRNEYRKGASADISLIIDEYLKWRQVANKSIKSGYSDYTTFLHGKLRSISHYLFNENSDRTLKAMFSNMFFKTEPISYRTYSYNPDTKQITGSNLRSTFVNAQKFNVEDIVRSTAYLVKTSTSYKNNLLSTYRIDRTGNTISIWTDNNPSSSLTVQLNKKTNKYVTGTFGGDADDNFKKQVIKDFLMFIVPDNYIQVGQSIENDPNWDWANDFAPFVGIIAYTLKNVNSNAVTFGKDNLVDLTNYTDSTLRIAKKLSIIYGSETKNVVKNLSGSNLPLYQLTNLTYNLPNVIDDVIEAEEKEKGINDPNSKYFDPDEIIRNIANRKNLFVQARELLIPAQVRQEISYGGLTKSADKLTVKELLQLNVFHDFYEGFLDVKGDSYGKVYLQSATYADKSTHYLFGYNLNKDVIINGQNINLFDIIKNIIDGKSDSSKLIELTRQLRAARINAIVENILTDYSVVFNRTFNTIDELSSFLVGKKYDDVVNAFKATNGRVKFYEEIHGTKPKYEGAPNIALNETMLEYYRVFNSPELFEQRLNKSRESFINSIDSNYWTWNKYDSPMFDKLYNDSTFAKFKDVNGKINTHIGNTLHPILEAYFLTDILLSNEINSLLIGEVWAHPNKNKRTTNLPLNEDGTGNYNPNEEEGTYEEFSEANRLIAQIKRSVAFGATYHPYIQNLSNGVPPEIRIAIIEDIPGIVFTPNGDEKTDLDSSDGSGIAHPLQSRFENNSLVDAKVGKNKKSIMMDTDPYYGKPTLLKWAVYELSNENRRNAILSRANLENIYKKMSDGNPEMGYDELNNYINGKNVCYKDYKSGRYYKILNFELTDENNLANLDENVHYITRNKIEINPQTGETFGNIISETISSNTLYDIDQALGGAWTGEFKDGVWEYNEIQLDIIEQYISENIVNGKQDIYIGYLVNKSAIKVGAGNTNKASSWNDDSEFSTITMKTKYGGVQMDADHELDMAEVTEMTQMISALIEDGHYKDIVESIYRDIGEVVASHVAKLDTAVKDVINNGTEEAKNKLYKILAESWINSFENKSKDTIGIAQAFVKKASDAFKKGDINIKVPFSAATINGSFVSDVIASINKGGIRHKYEGFAGVLNPSHDMIQYFRVWNDTTNRWEIRMFDQFMDHIKYHEDWTINFDDINSIFALTPSGLNPLLKDIDASEIDFEDTIVVLDNDKNIIRSNDELEPQFWYINSFTTYDTLKSLLRKNPDYKVYVHTGKPRNLKATNTKFTVNGVQYSIYDLDSVRTSQYLTKALNDKQKRYLNILNEDQLNLIKRVLGWRFNTDDVNKNPALIASAIKMCNNKTQSILKAIENGQSFEASEAFGINNLTRDELGNEIEFDKYKLQVAKLGTRKSIDSADLIDRISNQILITDSNFEYERRVFSFIQQLLSNPSDFENIPIGLSKAILIDINNAKELRRKADKATIDYTNGQEGSPIDIIKLEVSAQEALNQVIDRICDNVFDIQVNYILRRGSNAEPIQSLMVTASDYKVEAAEIITGRYQWEKFGLGQNDHIFEVRDAKYFADKQQQKYNAWPESVEFNLFDAILFGNDEQFLIKIGDLPTELSGKLSESTNFRNLEDTTYYQGIEVCSSDNKKFFTYLDKDGNKHHIIQIKTGDDLKELRKSSLFDNVIRYNWTEDNIDTLKRIKFNKSGDEIKFFTGINGSERASYIIKNINDVTIDELDLDERFRLNRRIERQAKDMFDSFKKQLNYVGARIPTQAMQSFMAMQLIAVVGTKDNVVYVPKSQTYLEGSDYDIDKLYILAHSVNTNGLVQIGTNIQSKYGLEFVSKLKRPENKDIKLVDSPDGATILTQSFIERFNNNDIDDSELIEAYNSILSTGRIYVEPYVNDGFISQKWYDITKDIILQEVDSYSKSVLTSKSDPNYLKNRVVSGIWDITNKLQNQLIAQIPVDMGDPQKAAQQSTLGKAELHINSDDPSAKMMMQQQNAVGKEVIGISAVSLKAFFGLYYYYSKLTDDLKQACLINSSDDIVQIINKLIFIHPITNKISSLANIDIDQVIDVIRNNPELKTISVNNTALNKHLLNSKFYNKDSGIFNLLAFCKYLRDEVNQTDAALTDSALISAATDNAKELILAKINATPELVDIYTYLTAIGTPFLKIADFMTCESFGFITKAGEVNIFDESTHSRKVKKALDWFLGRDLLPGAENIILEQLLNLTRYNSDTQEAVHANKESILKAMQDEEQVKKALAKGYRYLEKPSHVSDMQDRSDFYGKQLWVDDFDISYVAAAVNVLEWQLKMFDFKSKLENPKEELTKLTKIADLLPNVKEMSTMGQAQGINQGQRTNLYANRSFIKRLTDHVNDVFSEAEIEETFDFDKFVNDNLYRSNIINLYEDYKKSFNILNVLHQLPHFWEMLKTCSISKAAIKESSWRDRMLWNIADSIELSGAWLSEDNWKVLDNYLNDYIIASFLKENNFKFRIPVGANYYSGMSLEGKLANKVEGYEISLNSVIGMASFKKFVEETVIPALKINPKFARNTFISNLIPYANLSNDRIITGWKLPLDMMNIDASTNTKLLFANILSAFDEIANQSMFGMKIGDIFYLYNLIVNKDGYGKSSLTRLFENVINSDDQNSMAYRFNDFISRLDSGEITINPNIDEAVYRIKKIDSNFRGNSVLKTWFKLPSDFTLDLPLFFDLPIDINNSNTTIEMSNHIIDINTSDAIFAVSQAIADKYNDSVILVTDDDLINESDNIRNAKAFIKDGKVFININSANAMDGLHELVHLTLATMKFNDDLSIRQMYYNLVSMMLDRNIIPQERFDNIVSGYGIKTDDAITSDILEEVLANEFAFYLNNELRKDVRNLITIDVETNFLRALGTVLELQKAPKLSEIQGKSFGEIMASLGSALINIKQIDKDFTLRTQKVAKMEDLVRKNKTLSCK